MSRGCKGYKRMEEAGAGLLREGGQTRAPGEPQPPLRGWKGGSAIGLSLLQLRELVWDPKSLQVTQTGSQKEKLDVDDSKDDEDSTSTAGRGAGAVQVLSPERGVGVAGRDAQCPLGHAEKLCLELCASGPTAGHTKPHFSLWEFHLPTGLWLCLTLPTVPTFPHAAPSSSQSLQRWCSSQGFLLTVSPSKASKPEGVTPPTHTALRGFPGPS